MKDFHKNFHSVFGMYPEAFEAHRAAVRAEALAECAGPLIALEGFKAYVHRRLDEAGIPESPGGPHTDAGCRVGDRLDIALGLRK